MSVKIYEKMAEAWLGEHLDLSQSLPSIAKKIQERLEELEGKTLVNNYWTFIVPNLPWSSEVTDINDLWVKTKVNQHYTFFDIEEIFSWEVVIQKIKDKQFWSWFRTKKRSHYKWRPMRVNGIYEMRKDIAYTCRDIRGDSKVVYQSQLTSTIVPAKEVEKTKIRIQILEDLVKDREQLKKERKKTLQGLYKIEKALFRQKEEQEIEDMVEKEYARRQVSERELKDRYPFLESYKELWWWLVQVRIKEWLEVKRMWKPKYKTNCKYLIEVRDEVATFKQWRHPHISRTSWEICKWGFGQDFANVLATWDKYLLIELLYTFIVNCWVKDDWRWGNHINNLVNEWIFLKLNNDEDVEEEQEAQELPEEENLPF